MASKGDRGRPRVGRVAGAGGRQGAHPSPVEMKELTAVRRVE